MTMILDGKKISEELKDDLKRRVKILRDKGINPAFAIIRVGDVDTSDIYVRNKVKYSEDVLVHVLNKKYKEEHMTENELIRIIKNLNESKWIHGIIVQLPLPFGYDVNKIINTISPEKDVDGFTNINLGKLMNNQKDAIISATPKGIMNLLKAYNIDVTGKNCIVIGRGQTVGKPLAQLLINNDATVTVYHSKSNDPYINERMKHADIIFSCVGKYKLLCDYRLSDQSIVIDAGITRTPEGKLCGDLYIGDEPLLKAYSPVPKGVGPMTIQALIENVIEVCERMI